MSEETLEGTKHKITTSPGLGTEDPGQVRRNNDHIKVMEDFLRARGTLPAGYDEQVKSVLADNKKANAPIKSST